MICTCISNEKVFFVENITLYNKKSIQEFHMNRPMFKQIPQMTYMLTLALHGGPLRDDNNYNTMSSANILINIK